MRPALGAEPGSQPTPATSASGADRHPPVVDRTDTGLAELAKTVHRVGIPVVELTAGCRLTIGDLTLDVLAPQA
ncbi:hypothetical protein, partial [Nocardia farcinica]